MAGTSKDPHQAEPQALLARFGLTIPAPRPDLLELALTHRSWAVEHESPDDNERLEFLGDSVIGLAASHYLYRTMPQATEGRMSKLRAAMVSRHILGRLGRDIGLGPALRLGAGEDSSGGRERLSTLGSALEAFVGALALQYSWEQLQPRLEAHIILPALELTREHVVEDFKSRLQEWTQKNLAAVPHYVVLTSTGPDHARQFQVEAQIQGITLATGSGSRKKYAENDAAGAALDLIKAGKLPPGIRRQK